MRKKLKIYTLLILVENSPKIVKILTNVRISSFYGIEKSPIESHDKLRSSQPIK